MREIKFRIWNGKRMIYVGHQSNDTSIIFNEDGWQAIDHFTGSPEVIGSSEDGSKLMRYTGLKDKNGKEIYESDLVECNGYGLGIVVWWNHMWAIKSPGSEAIDSVWFEEWNKMAVIGNIYENPNLL